MLLLLVLLPLQPVLQLLQLTLIRRCVAIGRDNDLRRSLRPRDEERGCRQQRRNDYLQ
ncbi:hypothetical protein [Mesorhizobium sp. ORM8.1]